LFKGFSPEQLAALEGKDDKQIASQEREIPQLSYVREESEDTEVADNV